MRERTLFWLILTGYFIAGILYTYNTPPWQAPDEPAHYNYIRQLAEGEFPIIEPDDYNQSYQEDVLRDKFAPQYSLEPFEYEDHQPPLYYLLETPVYAGTNGSLFAMRLLSLFFGAGIILLAYAITHRIFPDDQWLALTAMAFVAFLPQHLAILASVNNDSLAWLLIAGMIYLIVHIELAKPSEGLQMNPDFAFTNLREVKPSPWLLGLLLGLGFLTKGTAYIMAPVIGVWLLWRHWGDWRLIWRDGWRVGMPAFALGLLWWVRNSLIYPGFDILAIQAHNSVVIGQPRTSDWVTEQGISVVLQKLATITFHSFWGQFGWMGVLMADWVYWLLLIFTIVIILGLLFAPRWLDRPILPRRFGWVFAGILLLNLTLFLGYNLTFVQFQGRYLFPSLIPIGIGVVLGLSAWFNLLGEKGRWAMPAFLGLGLFLLDLFALYAYIIPQLGA